MEYEKFKNTLLEQVKAGLPDDLCPIITQVSKSNGEIREGITLHLPGSSISPVIYISDMLDYLNKGASMSDIASRVISVLKTDTSGVDVSDFTDYSQVKANLCVRLISRKLNDELLKTLPYRDWNDLALICVISRRSGEAAMTAKVTKGLCEHWGVTEDQLFADALSNSPKIQPISISNMIDTIKGHIGDLPDVDMNSLPPMYVITSPLGQYGAACITYDGVLVGMSRLLNSNLAIIPSSIHEVIVLPVSSITELENISEMVSMVNAEQVSAGEVLSDHAYFYDRETDLISY